MERRTFNKLLAGVPLFSVAALNMGCSSSDTTPNAAQKVVRPTLTNDLSKSGPNVKPNILFFYTDQQNGKTTPPYGLAKTPNLDKLQKKSVTFSEAHTVSPHCCPSRVTLFTGLYPNQHGVWDNVDVTNARARGPKEGIRFWSEDLRKAGYYMAYSGKWHVSDFEDPGDRGFDVEFPSRVNRRNFATGTKQEGFEWDKTREFDQARETKTREGTIERRGYPLRTQYGIDDNPFNDRGKIDYAINVIRERAESDQSWCAVVAPIGPHAPYWVPQEFLDMYDPDEIELPANFKDDLHDKPYLYKMTADRFRTFSEQEYKEALRHYLALCTYEDYLLGLMLETLEDTGQADNTVIVYSSDHGDYIGAHGLFEKGLPSFKEAYHIPAMIYHPQIKNPGRIEDSFVGMADFAPTLYDVAGLNVPEGLTGRSLMPFIRDEKPADWPDAFFTQTNGNEIYGQQRAVMTKEWKLVWNAFDKSELYNLKTDPGELVNLHDEDGYEDIKLELYRRIWRFAESVNDFPSCNYIMTGLAEYGPGVAFET